MNDLKSRAICLLGMTVFVAVAWAISTDRRRFPWRVVLGGLALQLVLAFLVLRTEAGRWVFARIGDGFSAVMSNVEKGSGFLFAVGDDNPLGSSLLGTFAFGVLPTVIFFSSLMSVLYHLGIMQKLVWAMAVVMKFTLGTTGPETLAAAANVFVGHTEAPLVVRPYLERMTRSELCAMMTGGFATVTGGLLGAYAGMGIDIAHLLTASVISAPAALLIAKVMVPESPKPSTTSSSDSPVQLNAIDSIEAENDLLMAGGESTNVIGAAVEGASEGMKLALNVGAMLIAFLAILALIDALLGGLCSGLGASLEYFQIAKADVVPTITLGGILGYVGWPIAWLLGIPADECLVAGRLIGLKTVANEFVAFQSLGEIRTAAEPVISERTSAVLTYALAGFSNFAAVGIQVGGIGGLAPSRRADLASLGLRAMFGGLLACCITGAVAGLML